MLTIKTPERPERQRRIADVAEFERVNVYWVQI